MYCYKADRERIIVGIITLIYLSGAVTGTVVGEAFKPLGMPVGDANLDKECIVKTTSSKVYDKEIKDYIENVYTVKNCKTKTKESNRPIKRILKNIKEH